MSQGAIVARTTSDMHGGAPIPRLRMADLELAIQSSNPDARVAALREVTDLFFNHRARVDDLRLGMLDDVISTLAQEISVEVQAELANRLAPEEVVPRRTLNQLVEGPVEVAGPILRQSPVFDDSELAAFAERLGEEHLSAIAERRTLSPTVTDALVAHGGQQVLQRVVANKAARFSNFGFTRLVERSQDDEDLQVRLAHRADLPPALVEPLIEQASERVRSKLQASLGPAQAEQLKQILARAARKVSAGHAPNRELEAQAKKEIGALLQSGSLTKENVAGYVREGKLPHVVCAISALARIPLEAVENAVYGEKLELIVILSRALDLDWPTTKGLLKLRDPNVGQAGLDEALSTFDTLTEKSAARVVRFMAVTKKAAG